MYLNNKELSQIVGGGFTAAMLNALSRAITTIYNIGYALGSTIRRITRRKTC